VCLGVIVSRASRVTSAQIAYEVAKISWSQGLAQCEESEDIMAEIHKHMFQPVYSHYA
jgi:fido (protein-threonine AMPylation protein)